MTSTTEPLLTFDDPLLTSEGDTAIADGNDATEHVTENTPVASVNADVPPCKPHGRRYMLRLPKSVYDAFMATANAERRLYHVVLEKAIEEFLETGECEPRPYIPPMLKLEPMIDTQSKIDSDIYLALEARAMIEERSRNALGLRAVLNYLANHEGGLE